MMNRKFHSLAMASIGLALMALLAPARAADATTQIRLNTVGFIPGNEKKASIAATNCTDFSVVRVKDGAVVFQGTVTGPVTNTDTRELLYIADFSKFKKTGDYQLNVPDVGISAPFRVASDVYDEPFHVAMAGMYLWRCGTAVKFDYKGKTFQHGVCHTNDAWMDLVTGQHVKVESLKGWHDAGDYNKYVINAGVTVGCMYRAWADFPALHKVKLAIPESGGKLPDFLAEIKWETDWLLTMQFPDGSVSHKISTMSFGGFILPEQETADRFFVPWASAATADFVAMMAQTARYMRPYDKAYADRCLAAARKSYEFLKAHPANHDADMMGVTTGGYGTDDWDDRLWAAAELWETTGDAEALRDFEARAKSIRGRVDAVWDWGSVGNLGLFTYEFSKRHGRDAALVNEIRTNIISVADGIVRARDNHGYGRPLGTFYNWGCNGEVARQVVNLQAAYRLARKPEYIETSLDALNHLFGRNYYGRSFVTGLGFLPPMHPHDRNSAGDDVADPLPGRMVGGANPRATSWQDVQGNYRVNEIAINWNGALIYALAAARR